MPAISRRAAIAAALEAAGEAGVSGEALAADLGISRVAVNRHVASLRALGYEIESAPRVGHRLVSAPDACIPEEVSPRLTDPIWVACEGGPEVISTNDEAKRLARAGAPEGTAVVAAVQTGGRGRFGRAWVSPAGGAYVSCVLRPRLAPQESAALALVAGVGAARALKALGVPVRVKWPNDLEAGGRKLGGVLVEMTADTDVIEWVVVGCGINVASRAHERGAAVREFCPDARAADVAAGVLDGIAGAYREFLPSGFEPLRAEYEAVLAVLGQDIAVSDATGSRVAEGVVTGVDADGALVLATPAGERRVHAGEVTLRR